MKKLFFKIALSGMISASLIASAQAQTKIVGAGATFPYPIYSKWFSDYNKANPNVKINYQSIGSGGGIQQFKAKTVDFGASDAPLSPEEEKGMGAAVIHIPTVAGAVAIAYNTPGVAKGLKLNSDVLSQIATGKIKNWNDAKIAALNPGLTLPNLPLAWVYRSDGSGTTYVFTDYLTKASADFSTKVGRGKSVSWPTGIGAKGNEGVSAQIKTTPGAIGYIEFAYAHKNNIPYASIQNKAGKFIEPSVSSTTAAISGMLGELQKNIKTSITNASGDSAYPISALTFILVYQKVNDATKGKTLVELLKWTMTEGQKTASSLFYAPLPSSLSQANLSKINSIVTQ